MNATSAERQWLELLRDRPDWRPPNKRLVVVTPHPDDEILGAGGLIASHRHNRLPVTVIAVTDGEAAYPDADNLAAIREKEQVRALARIGVEDADIVRLRLPDGDVSSHEDALASELSSLLSEDTVVVGPWKLDPHPDHEACGRAVQRACKTTGAPSLSYFFWTWHRMRPSDLPLLNLRCLQLNQGIQQAKLRALREYQSQLRWHNCEPILPPPLLVPAQRFFETFLV